MRSGHRVVVTAAGEVALQPFDLPEPAANQALLRTRLSLISPGTERAFFLNLPNTGAAMPLYPGYSLVGEVMTVGDGVEKLRPGDRVVCPMPHASHALADETDCLLIADSLPDESALFFNLMTMAMQGVRKARIELGEPVVVLGAGIIGLLAMRLAQLSGGMPVVGIDLDSRRLELARRIGADDTLLYPGADEALREKLWQLLGVGASVAIESTGNPAAVASAMQLAAERGRVVLLGSARGENERFNFYRDVHKRGLQLIGAHNDVRPQHDSSPGYWTRRRDMQTSLELLTRGRVAVDAMITHRFGWRDFESAYAQLARWDKTALGMVIQWT